MLNGILGDILPTLAVIVAAVLGFLGYTRKVRNDAKKEVRDEHTAAATTDYIKTRKEMDNATPPSNDSPIAKRDSLREWADDND